MKTKHIFVKYLENTYRLRYINLNGNIFVREYSNMSLNESIVRFKLDYFETHKKKTKLPKNTIK